MQTIMPALREILTWDNRIESVTALPGFQLELRFADGAAYTLDFRPKLAKGGVVEPLHDPALFGGVRIIDDGTAIEFPGQVDFSADSLRWDAELQLRGLTRADVAEN